jgi:hypothetical protein
MKRTMKISALAALIAGSSALAIPASAQQGIEWTPESCKSEWTKVDANEDGKLSAKEAQPYTQVKTNIDTDNDGVITADEYTVACTGGAFKDMKKQG